MDAATNHQTTFFEYWETLNFYRKVAFIIKAWLISLAYHDIGAGLVGECMPEMRLAEKYRRLGARSQATSGSNATATNKMEKGSLHD